MKLGRSQTTVPKLMEEIWRILNEIPLNDLLREGRLYGGGLHKIEPKELRREPSTNILKLILSHR